MGHSIVMEGNMKMPPFLLPLNGMGFVPFHHTLMQVECNRDNATFLTIA